ncbi:hypothetical protein BKN38_02115 [Helicobacter sp. CLO-3]|uniref:copper chaperone PCu(A)C n=1 Tax=unclassified Helicobacter TaxID=2593540 RepID=UPI000805586C|nr:MULTISPECIES: copper chaperone PCu(A)C [unclassified Helicobacter]OBV29692.1 hypothetical protein BA723_04465 [Helicobacter sp. CLO-3]OHU84857.1 hypothetical protein BKN38_02115 [Helicobacter sp. CLO-3]
MKKTLVAFVLAAGVCALGAQNAESKNIESKNAESSNIDSRAKGSEKPSAESSKIAKIQLIKPSGFYAFETIGDSTSSAAFGKIANDSDAEISLKGAHIISEAGAKAEIHSVKMDKSGAMQMYTLKSLKIAPKSSIELAPKGDHIMLMRLPKALKDGEKIKIALVFGADAEVDFESADSGAESKSAKESKTAKKAESKSAQSKKIDSSALDSSLRAQGAKQSIESIDSAEHSSKKLESKNADAKADSSARDFTLELEIPIIKRPDSMPNHAAPANHSHAHDNSTQDNNDNNAQNAHTHDAHQSHTH